MPNRVMNESLVLYKCNKDMSQ